MWTWPVKELSHWDLSNRLSFKYPKNLHSSLKPSWFYLAPPQQNRNCSSVHLHFRHCFSRIWSATVAWASKFSSEHYNNNNNWEINSNQPLLLLDIFQIFEEHCKVLSKQIDLRWGIMIILLLSFCSFIHLSMTSDISIGFDGNQITSLVTTWSHLHNSHYVDLAGFTLKKRVEFETPVVHQTKHTCL